MKMRTVLLAVVVILTAAIAVEAGTRLEVETWAYDEHGQSEKMTIYVDNNRMRIDLAKGESSMIMISEGDKTELISLDHKPLEYVRFDKDDAEKFYKNIEAGMEQLQQFLPQMPADQQASIKKQMTGGIRAWNLLQAGREEDKAFAYEGGDSPETIAEVDCKQYVGSYKDKHYHDTWVAPFDKVATSADALAPLLDVHESFRGFFSMVLPLGSLRGEASAGQLGMPMRVVMYDLDSGDKFVRCEVLEIHSEDVDASRFEVDDLYDEITFDEWFQRQVGGAAGR